MSVPTTMHAAVFSEYGKASEVLEYKEVPTPELVADDDILIKVKAAGINPVDWKIIEGHLKLMMASNFPAIPGLDFSGTVVKKGAAVTDFEVDDEVYGKITAGGGKGTYAEYLVVSKSKDVIRPKPPLLSHTDAAGVGVCAMTAVTALTVHGKVDQQAGQKVLVIGASGGVGSWTILIAKQLGAIVTGVCSSKNVSYVQSTLKADNVIDYTVAPLEKQLTTKDEFDLVVDCVGGDEYWQLSQTILKPGGVFATAVGPTKHGKSMSIAAVGNVVGKLAWRSLTASRKYGVILDLPLKTFELAHTYLSGGLIKAPTNVIIPLPEVKLAIGLSESHKAVGKIVLNIAHNR